MGSWFVIGLSGVSCSGKTSLANNLHDFLVEGKFADPKWNSDPRMIDLRNRITSNCRFKIGAVHVSHQDDYFLPEPCQTHIEVLNHKNWELITALDMKLMCSHIEDILRNDMMQQLHTATPQPHNAINILIIEGFTIFENPFILELSNLKFHLHLPYEECFQRRKNRVYEPADVCGYFEMCVWPHYEKYFRDRIRDRKDIRLLNGELPQIDCTAYVLNTIGSVFKF